MQATNIISLADHRAAAEFKSLMASPDPENLFAVPMDDVMQEQQCANESPSDRIILGPRALIAVKRLFAAFGIEETPQTVGELFGAIHYCKFLQLGTFTLNTNKADVDLFHECVIDNAKTYYPELVQSFRAYVQKDLGELQRIARERLTLAEMARHYHPEFGWICTASRQRIEAGLPLE